MKAFKTYREQNPGKTYFDFKAYADGGEIPPSNKPVIPEEPQPYNGGIHIKKKNRGKFNALKKRTGKSTEELTHSKNPLTRKRAIFAQNAKKWKHKGRKKK